MHFYEHAPKVLEEKKNSPRQVEVFFSHIQLNWFVVVFFFFNFHRIPKKKKCGSGSSIAEENVPAG